MGRTVFDPWLTCHLFYSNARAARHGLLLNGKLQRVEKQEKMGNSDDRYIRKKSYVRNKGMHVQSLLCKDIRSVAFSIS